MKKKHTDCCSHDCGCGHEHDHEHDHDHGCGCGHDHGAETEVAVWPLAVGGALFVLAVLLEHLVSPAAGLCAYAAAWALLGARVIVSAGRSLVRGRMLDEHFLMSVATVGAFVIGAYSEAVGIMLFYRVGELFEERAVAKSRKQVLASEALRPETVVCLREGAAVTVPAAQVQPGELVLLRPGDRIPLDGTVTDGESRIDTAPITGEPVPRRAVPGDRVLSGCVNLSGTLTVQVQQALTDSLVSRILRSMEQASEGKPRITRFITRFAKVYTPIVVALAALTALVPSLVTGQWEYWTYTALSFLVMSCPCALVLSVPLAFFSAIGVGSRQGIVFKSGEAIEALAGVQVAAMDKTGTVTEGRFAVRRCAGAPETLTLAASCEQYSTHPLAVSITAAAEGLPLRKPERLEELPGLGIEATLDGELLLCGSEKLLQRHGITCPEGASGSVFVAYAGAYCGSITVADSVKPEAPEALAALRTMGLQTVMLTGDGADSAASVAGQLGIDRVMAGLMPDEKLEKLLALRRQEGRVLFVGDGINDAPVLSGADVGAAMGSGSDAALEAADVVFLTSRVTAIPQAVRLARHTRAIAWQNVVFALGFKVLVMALGLAGLASMWLAVAADTGVAIACILNATRLLYTQPFGQKRKSCSQGD